MAYLISSLCIFWALIMAVQNLKCKQCLENNSETCESLSTVECGNQTGCMTLSSLVDYDYNTVETSYPIEAPKKHFTIYKGCQMDIPCGTWVCLNGNSIKLQAYIECCSGEECNTDPFYIPVDREGPNGILCPSCYKEGSLEECKADSTVKCRGDETLCVDYRGTVLRQDNVEVQMAFKTCSNPVSLEYFFGIKGIVEKHREVFKSIPPVKEVNIYENNNA